MTHLAWAPPEWAEAARADARGPRGAPSVADDPALPRAATARTASTSTVSTAVLRDARRLAARSCSEVIELRLGGKRAQAPASIVHAAPDLRPARLLPLARRAAVGEARARAARRRRRPARRRLGRVARRCRAPTSSWRALFDRIAVSDIAWGRGRRLARPARRALAGDPQGRAAVGDGAGADALLLAGWLRSRLRRDVALRTGVGEGAARVAVDGDAVDAAARRPRRRASDLLSGRARPLRPRPDLRGGGQGCLSRGGPSSRRAVGERSRSTRCRSRTCRSRRPRLARRDRLFVLGEEVPRDRRRRRRASPSTLVRRLGSAFSRPRVVDSNEVGERRALASAGRATGTISTSMRSVS